MKRVCIKCKREIGKKETYYKINLNDKGKLKATDYVHYNCWQEYMLSKKALEKAVRMSNGIQNYLTGRGIIPEEVTS